MERRRHHSQPHHHHKGTYSRDPDSRSSFWSEVKRSNSDLRHDTGCSPECCPIQERLEDGRKPDCQCNNQRTQTSETRRERKQKDRKYENNMRSDRHNPPSPCGVTDCPNATDSYDSICLGPVASSDHLESIQHVDRAANDYVQTEIDDVNYYPLSPLPNCRCSRNRNRPRARRAIPHTHTNKARNTPENHEDAETEYDDRIAPSNKRISYDSSNYGENESSKSRRYETHSRNRSDSRREAPTYKREGFDSPANRRHYSREHRRGYETSSHRRQDNESPNYGYESERPRHRSDGYEDVPRKRREGYETESARYKKNDYGMRTDAEENKQYSLECYCQKGKYMCYPSPGSTVPCHCKKRNQKNKGNQCLRPPSNCPSTASLRSNRACRNTSCQTPAHKSHQTAISPRPADPMGSTCSVVLESPPPIECPPSKVFVPQTILECPTPVVECPPQRVIIPPPIVEYTEPIMECPPPPQVIQCPQKAGECPSPLQECRSTEFSMQRVLCPPPTVVEMPPQRVVIPIVKCPKPAPTVCRRPPAPCVQAPCVQAPCVQAPCVQAPCVQDPCVQSSNCSCAGKEPGSDRCCNCGCCRS
ncbi:pollen-specific leucine-rich repeat extensin-like protein 1 isoform X1 [Plutella xylostella]|uniref:pollen-specific leucine-rich repeat extensin-like protein 1 isoform X1 n=1 Tax=Plutella xylostella TaxID=51655 RepID=UPI0020326CB4|nr:pollen-specific leucine-rich repeat extensin-like protein 1 isoform X1 [Plutella xylostella]